MDNTSLGEMDLAQIPKEFRPNKQKHKSPWAMVSLIVIFILFGLFWFIESKKEAEIPVSVISVQETPIKEVSENPTYDLEASVGAIEIPNYSDEL